METLASPLVPHQRRSYFWPGLWVVVLTFCLSGVRAQAQDKSSSSENVGFSLRVKPSISSCLNLRRHPSTGSTIVDCLDAGTAVTEVLSLPGWVKVLLADGRQGWAAKSFLERLEGERAVSADSSLVAPASPLPRESSGDLEPTSTSEPRAFSHRVKESVTDCLNFRQEAEPAALVLECLAPKTPVREIYRAAGWMRVQIPGGREGWVAESYLASLDGARGDIAGGEIARDVAVAETAAPAESGLPRPSAAQPLTRPFPSPPLTAGEPSLEETLPEEDSRLAKVKAQLVEAQRARNDLTLRFEMMAEKNRLLKADLEQTTVALQVSEETRQGLIQETERIRREASESPAAHPIPSPDDAELAKLAEQLEIARERAENAEAQRVESVAMLQVAEEYGSELERQGRDRENRVIADAKRTQEKIRELETETSRLGETLAQERAQRRELETQLSKVLDTERESNQTQIAAQEATGRRLEELTTRNQTLRTAAADVESQLENLRQKVSQQSSRLAALEQQESELVILRNDLEARGRALSEAREREEELTAQVAQLGAELEAARQVGKETNQENYQEATVTAAALVAENSSAKSSASEPSPSEISSPESDPSESGPRDGARSDGEPSEAASERAREMTQQAGKMVLDWARAWSQQRVEDYLSFYSSSFTPIGMSREDWAVQRRQRVASPRSITVELSNLEVQLGSSGAAWVRFLQSYQSETFADRVGKVLELHWDGSGWKIVSEKVE